MATDPAVAIAKAQAILRERLAPALADSPLADMARWVATGAPPPAAELRAQGLDGAGEPADRAQALREVRKAFIRNWGFSIPCAECVAALRALDAPLVEIGAGSGYWVALLRAAGLDVIGADVANAGEGDYGSGLGRVCPIEALDGPQAVAAYPERDVFCSWPTPDNDWAVVAARALGTGRAFALIGDGPAGDIGTPELYAELAANFKQVAEVAIPRFPRVQDRLTIHRKVR